MGEGRQAGAVTITTDYVAGQAGARLAVHRLGEGAPVILVHGLFSNAAVNWLKFGHAARLAAADFACIMPDLRAHGQSAAPHVASAYPPDVLAHDLRALINAEGLGPGEFDLVGFSLGARTVLRGVLAGLAPRRLVLAGMGLEGLLAARQRSAFYLDAIARFGTIRHGDPAFFAQAFMKTQKVDLLAARLLLEAAVDTARADLARVNMPTLVVCGADDADNGSAPALAAALPNATYGEVPGTHMGSVTKPELGEAIAEFLLRP